MMKSQDSVFRDVFASLSLGLKSSTSSWEGYRSWSQVHCLQTLNTATIWLGKTSVFKHVFCQPWFSVLGLQF